MRRSEHYALQVHNESPFETIHFLSCLAYLVRQRFARNALAAAEAFFEPQVESELKELRHAAT